MAYNLAQLRAIIAPSAFLQGLTATQQNTAINRARQRIYNTNIGGGWKGGDGTVTLTITEDASGNQFITLPFGAESIVGVYGTGGDYNLQNEWFGFTRSSPGTTSKGYGNQLQDLGAGYCTFLDPPSTGLQPYFTTEGAATITIVGINLNGDLVAESLTFLVGGTQRAVNTYVKFVSIEINSGTTAQAIVQFVTAPTSYTDYSMFAGGVAPASGVYFANDGINFWIFRPSLTPVQWRRADLLSA